MTGDIREWLMSLTATAISAFASAASAQTPSPATAVSTPSSQAPAASAPAEDHIFALVQAGKCGLAKAAAEQVNDANLAEQIGLMYGAKSTSGTGSGGSRRGAGGREGSGFRGRTESNASSIRGGDS